MASLESFGRCPEGAHKLRVDLVEHLAGGFRRRMNERRKRAGNRVGPRLRILARIALTPRALAPDCCLTRAASSSISSTRAFTRSL